ncbi:cupin domain-containing protein [Algoriphagus aestuariicola]|jgi:mannose-6-phosphate isomerase-like protein (cupin superfamily)|uniref:Cupin domain-containing protein n=1 Tax=Algoriphagus aestuariicola TaxID=1852016 RepID=A0ABS3BWV7_9BACT|nr:cupin domain-containing protein [Algoriphagus aestuariicola]MBN7803555.1 cupin domain-containing protein [Algoriphagus aestuariicola]
MKNKIKKMAIYSIIILAGYLAIGYLFHLVIFPEDKPAFAGYFKPDDSFYSKAEGIKQYVEKQENGYVYCFTEIEPLAAGPPPHIHSTFDEVFEVVNGKLSIWVDGENREIGPGEKLTVPKGTPHKPYNPTSETIRTKGTIAFPERFAYHLPQVYGILEEDPELAYSPGMLLQMAMFTTSGFDSYIADGPPVVVQKIIGFIVTPLARILGYKSYYPKYDSIRQHAEVGLHGK